MKVYHKTAVLKQLYLSMSYTTDFPKPIKSRICDISFTPIKALFLFVYLSTPIKKRFIAALFLFVYLSNTNQKIHNSSNLVPHAGDNPDTYNSGTDAI